MQEYVSACPHHGMEDWLLIHNFYHGLVLLDRSHLDATAGGAFFLLSVVDAKTLIKKMVSNQGWSDDRLQPCKQGMHSIKEIDMLAAKMDLLVKRVEHYEKMSAQGTLTMGSSTSRLESALQQLGRYQLLLFFSFE
jgi:hypothetical protein